MQLTLFALLFAAGRAGEGGEVWAAGRNNHGQIGGGTSGNARQRAHSSVEISSRNGTTAVSAGRGHMRSTATKLPTRSAARAVESSCQVSPRRPGSRGRS